jgi:hypothetical protein
MAIAMSTLFFSPVAAPDRFTQAPAARQPEMAEVRNGEDRCQARLDAKQLCNAVSAQIPSRAPGVRYQYQELIRAAACVEADDSPDRVRAKVQAFWSRNSS